jgi:hypothetical protein
MNDSSNQQVSYGSPEFGPSSNPIPEQRKSGEDGYDQIRQIERRAEQYHQAELKEQTSRNAPPVQSSQKANINNSANLSPNNNTVPNIPKIFGYNISTFILNNIAQVSKHKGKGNPKEAKTWVYVLLDRLLKKQTYNSK